MRAYLLLSLSCLVGFLSISQEILWVRLIGFVSAGVPEVFANVLGCFLLGLAGGALIGKRISQEKPDKTLLSIALLLLLSAVVYFFSLPLIALAHLLSKSSALLLSYALVAAVAALIGAIFPLLCHEFVGAKQQAGRGVSWVYAANVIGCTIGPLLTGFVVLDLISTEAAVLLVTLITCAVATLVVAGAVATGETRASTVALPLATAAVLGGLFPSSYEHLLSRLQGFEQTAFAHVGQTKSGIVTVSADPSGDIVYGGGVYDGRFSLDPVLNANGIRRAYYVAALHPNPKRVLEIGLSSGSWARVVANHPDVEELKIVEISTSYLDIIAKYPEHATLLNDPKIDIIIDDGRRWMRRNPDEKFDFILMNSTWHWRSHSTNVLSREFLELSKKHLKPGGVIYYNSTWLSDVHHTASQVFSHLSGLQAFVAASDAPFDMTTAQRRTQLAKFSANGQAVFDASPAARAVLNELAERPTPDRAPEFRNDPGLITITDDNLLTEFKRRKKEGIFFKTAPTWVSALTAIFVSQEQE